MYCVYWYRNRSPLSGYIFVYCVLGGCVLVLVTHCRIAGVAWATFSNLSAPSAVTCSAPTSASTVWCTVCGWSAVCRNAIGGMCAAIWNWRLSCMAWAMDVVRRATQERAVCVYLKWNGHQIVSVLTHFYCTLSCLPSSPPSTFFPPPLPTIPLLSPLSLFISRHPVRSWCGRWWPATLNSSRRTQSHRQKLASLTLQKLYWQQ